VRTPGRTPALAHVAPPRSTPSQASLPFLIPSPQYAVPFTAGVQTMDALSFASVRVPN
jgi:hypothetical protein